MSTAPQGWQTPKTAWQAADIVHPSDFNRIETNVQAIETGQRTLDPSQAPSGNQGTLRQMLDWFANRIRAITGTTNWYDTPPGTLADLDTHIKRTDNPHGVTKQQVGLGNVENYGVATQAEAEGGSVNNKYMTPLRTKQGAQYGTYTSGVSGFSPATLKAALDALAGVRITEFGTNSNGTYVRFENGLQICVGITPFITFQPRSAGAVATVTLPATFTQVQGMGMASLRTDTDYTSHYLLEVGATLPSGTTFQVLFSNGFDAQLARRIGWIVVGRWK